MDVFSAPYSLWDDFYPSTRDNQHKVLFFRFFSVFNNILVNHLPFFYEEELDLINRMVELDYDSLAVYEYAPFIQHLILLVGREVVYFIDLLLWHPRARAFFRAALHLVYENHHPRMISCNSALLLRADLFLDPFDRASSHFFNSERSILETLVYMYSLPSPFYDDRPFNVHLDTHSLQLFFENKEREEAVDSEEEPFNSHPIFYLPFYTPSYPPDWGSWDDVTTVVPPEIPMVTSRFANWSFQHKSR